MLNARSWLRIRLCGAALSAIAVRRAKCDGRRALDAGRDLREDVRMKRITIALPAVLLLTLVVWPQAQTQTPPAAALQAGAPPAAPARGTPNNNDAFYSLGPDSLPREGVPHGVVDGPFMLPTNVYSGPLPTSTAQAPTGVWGWD